MNVPVDSRTAGGVHRDPLRHDGRNFGFGDRIKIWCEDAEPGTSSAPVRRPPRFLDGGRTAAGEKWGDGAKRGGPKQCPALQTRPPGRSKEMLPKG